MLKPGDHSLILSDCIHSEASEGVDICEKATSTEINDSQLSSIPIPSETKLVSDLSQYERNDNSPEAKGTYSKQIVEDKDEKSYTSR